ncbi:MAG: hypothetical protein GX781_01550 [Clostridiales bacterium]|nr:hypothetical protein [Clostridiales bacterium]
MQTGGAALIAPHRGEMVHIIKEGLFGRVSISLKKFKQSEIIRDESALAGVELVLKKDRKQDD